MNSHFEFLQTSSFNPCPLEQKLDGRRKGKINSEWLEQLFSDIKEGHALVIHLKILQTTHFVFIYSLQCSRLSEIVAIPCHTFLFFAEAHLVNEQVGCVMPQWQVCLYH